MKQLGLPLRTWGGKRKGAGRKPNRGRAAVSHLQRPDFPGRCPVHVTMRVLPEVGYLRGARLFQAICDALRGARERFGLRVVHFSVQGNHLHFIVEADGAASLTQGIQGLSIRIARALNRAAGRTGKVFADRYHARALESRREVENAIRYVLKNFSHHLRADVAPKSVDPRSSARWLSFDDETPLVRPRTWLLRVAPRAGMRHRNRR